MSVRMRAVLVGAILALVVAPAADAAKKKPSAFKLSGVKVSKSTVTAGDKVKVTGKAANRKGRKAGTATVTYSLRTKKSAKSGKRLGTSKVKKTKGGKSRKFSKTLTVPAATKAGTYFVFACIRQGKKVACGAQAAQGHGQAAAPARPPPPVDTRNTSRKLRDAITAAGMLKHLQALQTHRRRQRRQPRLRLPGLRRLRRSTSLTQLRAAGYSPTTQVFDFVTFEELSDPVLERGRADREDVHAGRVRRRCATPPRGDTGAQTITPVDVKLDGDRADRQRLGSGCEAADFAGFTGRATSR